MADIQSQLDNIKTAVYGRDIRSSIYDGINIINKEVERTTLNQEALKNSFNDLSDSFSYLNVEGNLINNSTIHYDMYVTNTGGLENYTGYYSTDYIEVKENSTYTINAMLPVLGSWYDTNKVFISKVIDYGQVGENYKTISPASAKYVRLNFKKSTTPIGHARFYNGIVTSNNPKKLQMLEVDGDNIKSHSINHKHVEGASFKLTNLIDKTRVTINVLLDAEGNEVIAGSTNIWTTDYIPVEYGQNYVVKELLAKPGLWYDCNKKPISWLPNNCSEPTIITPPKGACYCRWTGDTSCPIETTMFIKGDEYPSYYIPYITYDRFEIKGLEISDVSIISRKYKDRKYLVLGDSISANKAVAEVFYHDHLSDYFGFDKTNKAVSGSGWTVSTSTNDNLMQVLSRVEEEGEQYDLVTIFAGTNDYGRTQDSVGTKPFGEYGDTTEETFCGSVYCVLSELIRIQKNADIVVITPLPRENKNNANKYGKTLKDYRDIILKTCEDFSIPCIDLYKESGIYVFNEYFKNTYIPDGLHPNRKGHEKIANKVIEGIRRYISM